jgi:hypothetical protein
MSPASGGGATTPHPPDYQALSAAPKMNARLLVLARERVDRTEALKARIMAKIERLEDSILGQD